MDKESSNTAGAPLSAWSWQMTSWWVVIISVLLGIWGCLAIYSTQIAAQGDWGFLGRQVAFLVIGVPLMIACWNVPFKVYEKLMTPLTALALFGVIAVLFWGRTVNGMSGWFEPFPGVRFQPAELAKPIFVLAMVCMWRRIAPVSRWWALIAVTVITLAFAIPVAKEPDLGTTVIFLGTMVIFLFLTGMKLWRFLCGAGVIGVVVGLLCWWQWDKVAARFAGLFYAASDPLGGGWQVRQFQLAISRGGWTGSKLGNTVWVENYMPLAHNDSIFAAMAETLGMLGSAILLVMIAVLIATLISLSERAAEGYRKLFIATAAFMLALQAGLHISVNATLLPPTGLTLPFISYGGSSLLASMILVGMALSAAREKN